MANRILTADERENANVLVRDILVKLVALSAGDKDLLFAYRRKVYKTLIYEERDTPMARRKLKAQKRKE